jgi:hypothetical protein
MEKADFIQQACQAVVSGHSLTARELLQAHYPFQPIPKVKRAYSLRQAIALFKRDGFIDRYKGIRLVYPGALYRLSIDYRDLNGFTVCESDIFLV